MPGEEQDNDVVDPELLDDPLLGDDILTEEEIIDEDDPLFYEEEV